MDVCQLGYWLYVVIIKCMFGVELYVEFVNMLVGQMYFFQFCNNCWCVSIVIMGMESMSVRVGMNFVNVGIDMGSCFNLWQFGIDEYISNDIGSG